MGGVEITVHKKSRGVFAFGTGISHGGLKPLTWLFCMLLLMGK